MAGSDDEEEAKLDAGLKAAFEESDPDEPPHSPAVVPDRIASYTVLSVLGEGGMGWVLEAQQENPHRRVALKVINSQLPTAGLRRRFQRESRVLALLRHPAIAQIYEAGTYFAGDGVEVPFFAMELVEGARPITKFALERGLDVPRILELFVAVADGVEYGHRRGVVHRDLKPGNVLVDAEGRPRIIDFGLARTVDEDGDATSMVTRSGQILGTPQYMSPEQFDGDPSRVGVLSDVYSLGVLLFELVTGELPHDLESQSLMEMAETVRHGRPKRLAQTGYGSTVESLNRRDLDTIIGKALEKEPTRRYPSAVSLAADVRRFLRHQPIEARPPSATYQLRMFARRHKALVGAFLAILVVSTAAAVISLRMWFMAERRAEEIERRSYALRISALAGAVEKGEFARAREQFASLPEGLDGWERRYLDARLSVGTGQTNVTNGTNGANAIDDREAVVRLDASADGSVVAAVTRSGGVRFWDVATASWAGEFRESEGPDVRFVTASLDALGERVAVTAADASGLRTWIASITTGEVIARMEQEKPEKGFSYARLSPDGSRFARLSNDRIELFDVSEEVPRLLAHRIRERDRPWRRAWLAWRPDSTGIVVREGDEAILLSTDDFSELDRWTVGELESGPTFSRDGALLATCDSASIFVIALDGEGADDLPGTSIPKQAHNWIRFDLGAKGRRAVVLNGRNRIDEWNLRSGLAIGTIRSPIGLEFVRFVADDAQVLALTADGRLLTFDVEDFESGPQALRGHSSFVYAAATTADGARIVTAGWDGDDRSRADRGPGSIRWWDARSGEPIASFQDATGRVLDVGVLSSGEIVAVHNKRGTGRTPVLVLVLDGDTGRVVRRTARRALGSNLAIDTSRNLVALDGGILSAAALEPLDADPARGWVEYDPTGRWLAGVTNASLKMLRTRDGEIAWSKEGRYPNVMQVAFDPTSRWLAIGTRSGEVLVLEVATGATVGEISGHEGRVLAAAFSPDGRRLFTGDDGGGLHVIDTETWRRITTFRGHDDYIKHIHVVPDGDRVITTSGDTTARLWDLVPDAVRLEERAEHRRLVAALEPRVLALLDERGLVPKAAAALLKADASLGDREREVALQVLLRESVARDPDPLGEHLDE